MKPNFLPLPGPAGTHPQIQARRRGCLWLAGALLASGAASGLAGCQSKPAAAGSAAGPWSARQQQGLQALGFEPAGDDWALNLSASLLFEFDSDQLKSPQRARLVVMGRELLTLEVPRLRVEGHTDSKGDAAYNRQLALRRARTVTQTLTQAGRLQQALQVQGFGYERPIADNSTESGRSLNRRVVLIAAAA